jgi:hypothetical protein
VSTEHHAERVEAAPIPAVEPPAAQAEPAAVAGAVLGLQRAAGNAAVSRMLSRQENFTPAHPPISTPATPSPADYAKLTWEQLLPSAHGAGGKPIASVDLHTASGSWTGNTGTGQAPTLQYAPPKDIGVDPAAVAPKGGTSSTPEADAAATAEATAFAAAQDAAVAGIVAARGRIPARTMRPSPNNNAGWDYNPDLDPAAAGYKSWAQTALPSGVKATDWEWQVFQKIQSLEGQAGRFTTFDRTLSVGAGFSTSGGQTQAIVGRTFDLLPDVRALAYAAGLIVSASGGMAVVDTDRKWILRDRDADAYIQTQTQLLSLLVDVSQGDVPTGTGSPDDQTKQRQTFLDVQWKQFLGGTLAGVTPRVRGWPIDSAVLAAHAKHAQPADFPYGFWEDHPSSDLGTMVKAIYAKAPQGAGYICTGMYARFPHS